MHVDCDHADGFRLPHRQAPRHRERRGHPWRQHLPRLLCRHPRHRRRPFCRLRAGAAQSEGDCHSGDAAAGDGTRRECGHRRRSRLRVDSDGRRRRHADGERQRNRRHARGRENRRLADETCLAFDRSRSHSRPCSPSTSRRRREAPAAPRHQRVPTPQSISPASGSPSSRKTGDGA